MLREATVRSILGCGALLLVAAGCGGGSSSGGVVRSPDFVQVSSDPVVTPTALYESYDMYVPFVLKVGATYYMYYTCSDGTGFRTALATSGDGVNWTKEPTNPVLVGSGFDAYSSSQGSVIYDGTQFRMWYSAYAYSNGPNSIAYATSPDGIAWTRLGPVISTGTAGSPDTHLDSTSVIADGPVLRMWYEAQDSSYGNTVCYATSTDGIHWTKYAGNPVFQKSASGWDSSAVVTPRVIKVGTAFKMFYGGIDPSGTACIGEADSSDGIHWTRSHAEPVLRGTGSDWEVIVIAPAVLLEGGTYFMWFDGIHTGVPDSAIGLAVW